MRIRQSYGPPTASDRLVQCQPVPRSTIGLVPFYDHDISVPLQIDFAPITLSKADLIIKTFVQE